MTMVPLATLSPGATLTRTTVEGYLGDLTPPSSAFCLSWINSSTGNSTLKLPAWGGGGDTVGTILCRVYIRKESKYHTYKQLGMITERWRNQYSRYSTYFSENMQLSVHHGYISLKCSLSHKTFHSAILHPAAGLHWR